MFNNSKYLYILNKEFNLVYFQYSKFLYKYIFEFLKNILTINKFLEKYYKIILLINFKWKKLMTIFNMIAIIVIIKT